MSDGGCCIMGYNITQMEKEHKIIEIIIKHMKVKGDMLVMENISRKKNKKDFEELEKFLNEYQRQH